VWGRLTRELADRGAEARQARDDAWKPVMAANERLRAARQARLRLLAAQPVG
jgi:hypothetical protein